MINLIIGLIATVLYFIAMVIIIGGVLILPFIIKGGWIFFVIIIACILCAGFINLLEGENESENRN